MVGLGFGEVVEAVAELTLALPRGECRLVEGADEGSCILADIFILTISNSLPTCKQRHTKTES